MEQDLFGVYQNELGSEMTLRSNGPGKIEGQYHTNAGDPTFKDTFKLEGSYLQEQKGGQFLITWAVRWVNEKKDFKSITTWNGQSENGNTIIAQYILKVFGSNQYDKNKFTGGQDTFKRKNV